MKTQSNISLNPAGQREGTFYFIWYGHHQALLDIVHSPEMSKRLHNLLGTRKQARVWCPNDEDRVVTLVVRNKGTIVSS